VAVPEIFNTIEQSGISTWIRTTQSVFGFYFILTSHTIGLCLLVGSSAVVDLRILGVGLGAPLKALKPLFKLMAAGLLINFTSGILLLIGYPTKALTDIVFYFKLAFIALAVVVTHRLYLRVFNNSDLSETEMIARGKTMAKLSIAFWVLAIFTGRALSETFTYLTYGGRRG
jgi:hypothetical protein